MSKVSALISAYYAEDWLEKRLNNLFDIREMVVEPIVVCQINSPEDHIASEYAINIIRTFDIPTIGKAWNLAIQWATGEYLTTANTDDSFYSGGLLKMVDILETKPQIGLVFSQVDLDDLINRRSWQRIGHPTGEVRDIKNILARRCIVGPMPVWRASIHENLGMFREDYKVASDYDMWRRMAKAGVRFYYVAESLGVYTKRADSLEHRNPEACKRESQEVQKCG